MKIVVNAGNIGTPTAVALAKLKHDVTLTVRTVKPNPEWDGVGLRQVPFDVGDPKSVERVLQGADAFFSLTPLVENLVDLGVIAAQAAKKAGVKRIVRSSAQGAGPNAGIKLGRLHGEVEQAVKDTGIPYTMLRPANFMQNYLMFAEPIKSLRTFYAPTGSGKVSAIDTRDISAVAAAVLVELGHEGKAYELTGGEALSNDQVAEILSRQLGNTIRYIDVPESAARDSMLQGGMPAWLVDLLSELNAIGKAGYLAAISPDVENVLKRKPITFAEFARDFADSFRSPREHITKEPTLTTSASLSPGLPIEDMKRLVVKHFDDFVNRKDLSAIDRNMSDDFLDHDGPGGKPIDRAGDRIMMAAMHAQFSDLRVEVLHVIAEGDKVMVRNRWTGTHAANGRKMEFHGFVLWRISGGRIAERWATVTPPAPVLDHASSR